MVEYRKGYCCRHKGLRDGCVLSSRQKEVLEYISQGKTSFEIANMLQIKEENVKFHLDKAMKKLNAKNRAEAISNAVHFELIKFKAFAI